MKNQLIVLFAFVLCGSQEIWAQEAPKLAAFSISGKAPENTSEVKTTEPVMAIWSQEEVIHPANTEKKRVVVPELAIEKKETPR